jgi:hypothetical protein
MVSLDYLESERIKIWQQIVELRKEVEKKTSDFENEAKQSAKKSVEYRNKSEASSIEARQLHDDIMRISEEIQQSKVGELVNDIKVAHDNFIPRTEAVAIRLTELETLFAAYSTYADKLKKLDELTASADDSTIKIETIFKQLVARKNEIDQMYYEIFGYSTTDSKSGETTIVLGLKDELEKSYAELKINFEKFAKQKEEEFNKTFDGWKSQYVATHEKIKTLLPDALTAGLSAAYSKKKSDEITDHKRLEERFAGSVIALIVVSTIPFFVSIYLLTHDATLEETLLKMPRLVLAILPLYIPVMWLAYSFNRKMNLSKRLIEEYTHKEVLSKTFEGLSTQIQNIEDSEISTDLKTRLLYNILEVSSENPGKLISNYNNSDHPLMDALDKSVKLTQAIEHLSKVPGMSKLVGVLDNKAKTILEKEDKKAASGIDSAISSQST